MSVRLHNHLQFFIITPLIYWEVSDQLDFQLFQNLETICVVGNDNTVLSFSEKIYPKYPNKTSNSYEMNDLRCPLTIVSTQSVRSL